jgi:hypothetical protein
MASGSHHRMGRALAGAALRRKTRELGEPAPGGGGVGRLLTLVPLRLGDAASRMSAQVSVVYKKHESALLSQQIQGGTATSTRLKPSG